MEYLLAFKLISKAEKSIGNLKDISIADHDSFEYLGVPVTCAVASRLTTGFSFKLLRFCDALANTRGRPVDGLYSIVRWSKANLAASCKVKAAVKVPLACAFN